LHWNLATPAQKGASYDEEEARFQVERIFDLGGLYKFGGVYYVTGHQDGGTVL